MLLLTGKVDIVPEVLILFGLLIVIVRFSKCYALKVDYTSTKKLEIKKKT